MRFKLGVLISVIGMLIGSSQVHAAIIFDIAYPQGNVVWLRLGCVPPFVIVLPLCLLGESGEGTTSDAEVPATEDLLTQNGYSAADAKRISEELKQWGEELKSQGRALEFETGDTPEKIHTLTGLSMEAAGALLEISGR